MIHTLHEELYKGTYIYTMHDTGAIWYEVDDQTFNTMDQAKAYIDKEKNNEN